MYCNITGATDYPHERFLLKSSFNANESWIVALNVSATLLYLNNVLHWPEDDHLRSKHVAAM